MNDFFGYIAKHKEKPVQKPGFQKTFESPGLFIGKNPINKFADDTLFQENQNYFILLNGVVYNKSELLKLTNTDDLFQSFVKGFEQFKSAFFKKINGSFSGLIYNKQREKCTLFTNHFGDKQVFYYHDENHLVFSNKTLNITTFLKENNIKFHLGENGISSILSYGFMLKDFTLIEEVKKLDYGSVLNYDAGKCEKERYWDMDNTRLTNENEADILRNVDTLFKQAIERQYGKDREYNYDHFATLSAGLDARMNVWVANHQGFDKQTNFTFSSAGYFDQTIAQQMADYLKNDWLFQNINSENFLDNYDSVAKISEGRCLLSMTVSGYNCLNKIDFDNYGVIHTGQLGDVILSSYNNKPHHYAAKNLDGAFARNKQHRIEGLDMKDYPNAEYFLLTQRGFNGILQGNLNFQERSEVASPFLDIDFFEYCMSIPPELRFNHLLYLKWLKMYYPKAGDFIWDKIIAKPNSPIIQYKKFLFPLSNILHPKDALLPRLGKFSKLFRDHALKNKMLPLVYWYARNPELKAALKNNIEKISSDLKRPDIIKDLDFNNFNETIKVLTVLSGLKHLT